MLRNLAYISKRIRFHHLVAHNFVLLLLDATLAHETAFDLIQKTIKYQSQNPWQYTEFLRKINPYVITDQQCASHQQQQCYSVLRRCTHYPPPTVTILVCVQDYRAGAGARLGRSRLGRAV